ncbi:hypothetical protein AAFF_G00331740 [Aldrovandia affinis]|uniref:Uncharacterized protein n=1 Tax=Aldrovandia affinis TaxID=143900 RepID=A0AAD7WPS5_9TELE|nr:hypothetical protein AAFF_G00331740 [Aldrovandia affinis]
MAASAGGSTNFSSCSGEDFETLIFRGGGVCLKNQPSNNDIVTVAECGNGMLEEGEQCDCGEPEECNDKCCEAATCQFTPGSACSEGACCRDCQVRVSGTPCRKSVNVCDLPEFCNGQSAFCPEDFYIMDGHACAADTAYCYEGRCQTYDHQCQQIFGNEARKAADICFRVINARGNQIGNCGGQAPNFVPCNLENAMCGKVQCTNVSTKYLPEGAMVTLLDIGDDRCVNADFNFGSDVLDPGYVKTGSGCDRGKACLDFKCLNASALLEDANCDTRENCNSNGVCNDQGHCHCDDGWAPPACNRAGNGGSVDSGPTKIDYSLRDGLLIFFLLVVPILLLIAILLLYMFRRDWMNKHLRIGRSRRNRSKNTASSQANGNAQTRATPQPRTQSPPISEPPPAYPEVISVPPSYEELKYGNRQYPKSGIQPPRPQQGPGVPKPIPQQGPGVPKPIPTWQTPGP